jgi:putative acetyltransferase
MSLTIAAEPPLSPQGRRLIEDGQRALEALGPPGEIRSVTPEQLAGPDVRFLVARDEGRALGCVALVDCGTHGEVRRLFVREAARGRGIARALLAVLEAEALKAGLRVVRAEAGPRLAAAVGFFRRAGYAECGRCGDGTAHPAAVVLEKRLG